MPRRAGCFHSREKYFRDSFSFLPPPPLRGTSLSIRFFDEQGVAVNSHVPSQPILTVHRAACFVINVMRVDAPSSPPSSSSLLLHLGKSSLSRFDDIERVSVTSIHETREMQIFRYVRKQGTNEKNLATNKIPATRAKINEIPFN